jgi:uncharacterized protein
MKDERILVRLENLHGAVPAEQEALLLRLRRLSAGLNGKVMNLRVSPRSLEFDLFGPSGQELAREAFAAAWTSMGPVITWRRLDPAPPLTIDADAIMKEARTYFNEARYWEVHEVLEALWKAREGSEKQLLQGLILLAAALVHTQRHEWGVVWPMIAESLRRLKNQPAVYHEWNIQKIRETVEAMASAQQFSEFYV